MRRLGCVGLLVAAAGCAPVLSALPEDPGLLRPTRVASHAPPEPLVPAVGGLFVENGPSPPEIDAAPAPTPAVPAQVARAIEEPPADASHGQQPVDAQVQQAETRADRSMPPGFEQLRLEHGQEATLVAARVGDSIITLRELKRAVRDRLQGQVSWSELPREQKNRIGRESLEYLIDRAIILQEARRKLDKPKQWETFREFFEKSWKERELPALMRRYKCENEIALRIELEKAGDSLDELRETYLQDQMVRAFTSEVLKHKLDAPSARELYRYYRANLSRFDRPAEIRWREIFLSVEKHPDEAARRKAAEALLARLRKGEDFAALARAESDSPRAAGGGLWATTPGGFASKGVNEALERLPVGAVSEVIEDPRGLYIVRVESRRPAGPARFEDVQVQIGEVLTAQSFEKALDAYISEIRRRTAVSSPLFDGTDSAPLQSRALVPADPGAARVAP